MKLLAGTKPSKVAKVAARLSLADWLLVVFLGTGTSVSSYTDAIADATVALVRVLIIGDMVGSERGDSSLTAPFMSSAN